MFKKIIALTTYILIFINFNLFAEENKKTLKIGLLAPFSGDYRELGQSIMFPLVEIGSNYLIKEFPEKEQYEDAKDKVQKL